MVLLKDSAGLTKPEERPIDERMRFRTEKGLFLTNVGKATLFSRTAITVKENSPGTVR
jgi:hypothetical protein